MECHHKREVSNYRRTEEGNRKEQQLRNSGREICAADTVGRGELRRTEVIRQAKNALNTNEAGTRLASKFFGIKWYALSQPPITTCTQSWCFKRLSTLVVSIGLSIYAWLVVALAGEKCTRASQSLYSLSLVMVVEASSACSGNTDCVYGAKESHKHEAKTTNEHFCSCHSDIGTATENVAGAEGDFVLQATAHSTLLGEGFHRTMLTMVHISSSIADEKEKRRKNPESKRELLQNRSGSDRDMNKQTEESEKRLKKAFEREEREAREKQEEKQIEEKTQEETRDSQSGNDKTVREGAKGRGTREGQTEANRRRDAGRRGERTRGREDGSGTRSEGGRKYNGRSGEGRKTGITQSDNDDSDPLICTVTCEYTLDKIVYVDPDQTWELGLRGHATLDTGKSEENVFPTSFSSNSSQMGSLEVLAPAVDLEAPVFAPYLPSKLHVRQTIENVLLKRSSEPKKCRRTAALNHDTGIDKKADTRMPENAVSEDVSSPSLNSRRKDSEYLHHRRKPHGKDGLYFTQGGGSATGDASEHEGIVGTCDEGVHAKEQRSDKQRIDESDNYREDSPECDITADDDDRRGSLNGSAPDKGDFKKTNNSFEAFVNIELPLHHRYDAACSKCDGLSLHHIETPVAKVVCCRRKVGEQAKSQLPRIFHQSEAVRAMNAAGISGDCCDQKQITGTQHNRITDFPSASETTMTTDASTSHAASSYAYCISAESIAIAVGNGQEKADWRSKSASTNFDTHPDVECCNDSTTLEKTTVNLSKYANVKDLNARRKTNHQGSTQADQKAAEGTADGGRVNTETTSGRWEGRKGSEDNSHYEEILFFQVPVGSAEDLPWVTVVTLTTVGVLVVLTAWIVSYAEARGGCWTGMTTNNAKQE